MSSYSSRVARLEATRPTAILPIGIGVLSHDPSGSVSGLTLRGTRFGRGDESEEVFKDRVIATVGPFEKVIWVEYVRASRGAEE